MSKTADELRQIRAAQAKALQKAEQMTTGTSDIDEADLKAAIAERDSGVKTHKPTRPWDQKKNPYRRNMFGVQLERPGYKIVWPTIDRVRERLEQGYTLCRPEDYGDLTTVIPGEESSLEPGIIRRREHVAMEMPLDQWKAMKEEKANRDQELLDQTNRDLEAQTRAVGSNLYNPVRSE